MDKDDIKRYLQLLGQELHTRNTTGDILLLGGAVMLLEVGNRATTQDIDASFEGSNATLIRQAIKIVAQREGLAQDWLNDGAKGFLYSQPKTILWKRYPGLNVYIPSLDYILAMKSSQVAHEILKMSERCFKNSISATNRHCSQSSPSIYLNSALMCVFNISSLISSSHKGAIYYDH